MWAELAAQCAPNVAPATIEAVIRVESGGNPLALHVNGVKVQPVVPKTTEEAVRLARDWITRGYRVDLGLMQVTDANLPALGLTLEQVFDPCTNIRAGAAILSAGYVQAVEVHGPGQAALKAALSAYNTGDFARGFMNGYVERFYGPVPAQAARPAKRWNPYTEAAAVWWEMPP